MKKNIFFRIATSILLVLVLLPISSCAGGELLASYEKGSAPSHVINAGGYWYTVISEPGKSEKEISVSRAVNEKNVVHTVNGGMFECFVADEYGCAWTESDDENYIYYCYSLKYDKVKKLRTSPASDLQMLKVGISGTDVYYAYIDYADSSAAIYCYNMENGETTTLHTLDYAAESTIDCLDVNDGFLTAVIPTEERCVLLSIELATKKTSESPLPESVARVFDISFNADSQKLALYYNDGEREKIAVLDNGEISEVCAFSPIQFAYKDEVAFADGIVYWVREITDTHGSESKYTLVAHDCAENKTREYADIFYFSLTDDGFYGLEQEGGENYEKVNLFNY